MKKEFIQTFRNRKMIAIIIVMPVIQLLLLGYAANIDIKDVSLVVCDEEKSQNSYDFLSLFSNSGYFTIVKNVDSPNKIDKEIDYGDASVGIIIPSDFTKNLNSSQKTSVEFIADGSDANSANIALGYAKQIISSYSNRLMLEKMNQAGIIINVSRIVPEPRIWYNPDLKSSNYMIPGVLALILMIITMSMTSLGIVREKEMGTLEQLIVTPIRRYEFIIGKLLPFAVFGFIDMAIILTLARFWFNVPMRGDLFTLYFLSGLYILTTLGLGLLVSTFSKTQQQAMMTSMFFIMMPFMYLSGFAFPIDNMPIIIQYITYIIPLKYYLIIVRGLFLKGNTIFDLWKEVLILLLFGVTILSISIKRFNKKLD
jgi:ABC-2 type transport system permease protein